MDSKKIAEVHIICTVKSRPEFREKVRDLLLELIAPARGENGCLYYNLYWKKDEPDTFILLDGWSTQEALNAHAIHPNVPRVVDQMLPMLSNPIAHIYTTRLSEPV